MSSVADLSAALGDIPVVVAASNELVPAYFEMADRRRAGAAFAAMFLIPDQRGAYAYSLATHVVHKGDYDHRRELFDGIASANVNVEGRPITEHNRVPVELRTALADMSRLPDVLIVRSRYDAQLQRLLRGYGLPNIVRWYPSRRLGDWTPGPRRRYVVIWAPNSRAEETAIHTFALFELHAEVVVISKGGQGTSTSANYLEAGSPQVAGVLSQAICIVDVTLDDPSWTQAFAERGLSVAAAMTSGANEVADGVALYEPWSYRSICTATLEAMSRPASHARESAPSPSVISRALDAARPPLAQTTPLVSMIVPTYNRRDDVIRILTKLKEQRYENFEIVVVNDGGESVADLAPLDARIRAYDRESNAGVASAVNFGMSQAKGTYIGILADDDELYADHLLRLVAALEGSGIGVAHSNIMIRFEAEQDGRRFTSGYNCSTFIEALDPLEVYASSPIAGNAMLVRREVYERAGAFREDVILADQEIQIRFAQITDFVHVPHVTGEWLVRDAGDTQLSHKSKGDLPSDMRRIYELHPKASRYLEQLREVTIRTVAGRPPGHIFPQVVKRVPQRAGQVT
ncbi:MAG: glycosyltransferase family 2 protein [Vulcanimicrobiaceae bacterium]|jgi:hypothetical protein